MRIIQSDLCVWCGRQLTEGMSIEGILCSACVPALLEEIRRRLDELEPQHTKGSPRLRVVARSG